MLEDIVFCDLKEEYSDEVFAIEKDNILEAWSYENIRSLICDEKARARVGLCNGKVICYYSFYVIVGEGFINNLAVELFSKMCAAVAVLSSNEVNFISLFFSFVLFLKSSKE